MHNQGFVGFDAGAMLDRPYLAAQVVGLAKEEGENRFFQLKYLFVVPWGGWVLSCTHAEAGYEQTFKRVTNGLVASLRQANQAADRPVVYHEIQVVKVNGLAVGFVDSRYFNAKAGGLAMIRRSAMLVPRSPTELMANDELYIAASDGDGELVDGVAYGADSTEQSLFDVKLSRAAARRYAVEGTVRGKPLSTGFDVASPLVDDRTIAHALASIAQQSEWHFAQWVPSVNPGGATEVGVHCPADRAKGSCDATTGALKLKVSIDQQGTMIRTQMVAGGMQLTIERVFSRGAL